jgi:hypothetical protein
VPQGRAERQFAKNADLAKPKALKHRSHAATPSEDRANKFFTLQGQANTRA